MSGNEFRFFLSCDINLPVTFRVERLEGHLPAAKSSNSGILSCPSKEKKMKFLSGEKTLNYLLQIAFTLFDVHFLVDSV